jgi:hypothetical protein
LRHFGISGLAHVGGIVGTVGLSDGIVCAEEKGGVRQRRECVIEMPSLASFLEGNKFTCLLID